MDKCQRCGSGRVLRLSCRCSDLCSYTFAGKDSDGYAPCIPHVTGNSGDYVSFAACLECGQLQGKFPEKSPQMDEGD
jgi:hypothetical protein